MAGKLYIGTSGWQYKHWRGTFYPDDIKVKDHFDYYLKHFNTVEVNASFYRIPTKETFAKWHDNVGDDFIYVIKANRYITHYNKLKDTGETLDNFLSNASELKEKLGPILFQLPPGWEVDTERLENFLNILPKDFRYVFEFRNNTWYNAEVDALLKKYNCAFCIYQLGGHLSPIKITADFVYIRLHGPKGKYKGSYTDETLNKWADNCREWLGNNNDVYVYFDNDEKGYAAFNALRLKQLLKK
ncbi:DUF72 domain-containing protein [Flavobacterium sp. NRK1]|uniref:DUF72 domain-containing protein n=1 Tax=Flavobacterium sp. NRK1 TaxID=2954929 RepID=UPI002092CDC2|nr:DUF72 domain-containing protein [Flavobacterium sp. NRK1]MCO6149655.1 DUF72 domain-containing protein [Flavobacterium sp. NRK1]